MKGKEGERNRRRNGKEKGAKANYVSISSLSTESASSVREDHEERNRPIEASWIDAGEEHNEKSE